jgi:hypothetical protein
MIDRIGRRLTYANVMSTLAVFGVLAGGTALALPGRNSVDSGDIRNGQVKAPDVADLEFKNAKLLDGWLDSDDDDAPPGFAIDAQGVVHLRGALDGSDAIDGEAFRLPRALRPAPGHRVRELVLAGNNTVGVVNVFEDGSVLVNATDAALVSLDGITFTPK